MKKTNAKRNLKNKKRKTKKVRKNMKKGGEYIDSGSYGAVYANPRLLCQGENGMTPNINDEVSKIFEDDESAEKENNNVEKLKTFLQERGILEEFKNYAIIPERICNLNRASLIEPPYNTDEWKKNKINEYYYSILNEDIPGIPRTIKIINDQKQIIDIPAYNKLIISDKGGDNLYKIIEKIRTYDQFKNFLQKLTSIGKGIQLLQNNGLIHGDIKDKNCLEHNGRFKIIDLSDIREISTTTDPAAIPTAFGYHIWPITAFYTYLFDEGVIFNKIADINKIITLDQIKKNYSEGNYNNYNAHGIYYSKILFNSAFRTDNIGYTKEQLDTIEEIKDSLIDQKILNNIDVLRSIIQKFNKMFISEFKDIAEFKLDLFKRIDIYSFGIIILQCIEKFLKSDYSIRLRNNEDFCKKMIELYRIVGQCCDQKERVADINEIIDGYSAVVNTM
jgi:serine/threonine protein kinase